MTIWFLRSSAESSEEIKPDEIKLTRDEELVDRYTAKAGDTFTYEGTRLTAVTVYACTGCYFRGRVDDCMSNVQCANHSFMTDEEILSRVTKRLKGST